MLEGNLHMANHPAENTAHLLCKKIGEGEKAAYNKLSTELAKELKPLLDENKEVSSWTVDIHTCQLRQQEAKVERMRGKLYLNVD